MKFEAMAMNNEAFDFPSHEVFVEVSSSHVYSGFKAAAFTTGQFSVYGLKDEGIEKCSVHISLSAKIKPDLSSNVHIAISSAV
jgi:hypothetical protein